jgi:hypothetical protein
MNYADDDYVMGHLLAACRRTEATTLAVDLLTGEASPRELLVPPVTRSIAWYSQDFPGLVARTGSDMSYVASARMLITFDISVARPAQALWTALESPYECVVEVIDDRGKKYSVAVNGWWFPENTSYQTPWSYLLSLVRRFVAGLRRAA